MINFDTAADSRFGVPTSLCDQTGRRLLISDQYAELLLTPKDDLIGKPWQATAHAEDLGNTESLLSQLISQGTPFASRWRMRRGDGTWLSVVVTTSRLVDHKGQIFIQGNFCPEKTRVEASTAPIMSARPDSAYAEYIREMALELSQMAGERKMVVLEHLLRMANAEAADELQKRIFPDLVASFDQNNSLH